MTPLSIYLHIPFCQVRCAYCDFNTYAGLNDLMPAYVKAMVKEIRWIADSPSPERSEGEPQRGASHGAGGWGVHTVFFGGGTPSLLPLPLLADLLAALRDSLSLTPDCEITLEANPGTVDAAYLAGLREHGVNRLSFGVQSAQPSELRLLNRLHTFEQVVECVKDARAAGFNGHSRGLNLDLIFGLPHQTLEAWQDTVARVLELQPEHLSLYALSLDASARGTPMRSWIMRGLLPLPDPDLAADMYEWASETLEAHGYVQYEISNWAKRKEEGRRKEETIPADSLLPSCSFLLPDFSCLHNLQYWRNLPYLGFGAGAHGCVDGYRYSNVLSPQAYIGRMESGKENVMSEKHSIDRDTAMNETMMLGLRLVGEGVSDADFRQRFGIGLEDRFAVELNELSDLRLLEWDGERARLRRDARLVANQVFRRFV